MFRGADAPGTYAQHVQRGDENEMTKERNGSVSLKEEKKNLMLVLLSF